jgi:uroporphyrin-III C-methyltransferase
MAVEATSRPAHSEAAGPVGKVWLVGFGPGDPELMTIKADRILRSADIIFYDSLIDSSVLERYPGERVFVGKRKGCHAQQQAEINKLLYEAAAAGKEVVRLKGGDPCIFGRAGEEIEYLRERNVPVEIVPGVTAASAAAAACNVSLTMRGVSRSVVFKTAHYGTLEASVPGHGETRVYYMGASRLAEVAQELRSEGWQSDTPVALVHNATSRDQRIAQTDLAQMANHEMPSPIIVIVGEVARDAQPDNAHQSRPIEENPMPSVNFGEYGLSCLL